MPDLEENSAGNRSGVPRFDDDWYTKAGKRSLDVALSAGLIVLSVPIVAAVTMGLRLQLGPPVLLFQSRVGQHGKPFRMVKFRTMEATRREQEELGYVGPERRNDHKSEVDPRHTSIGRIVRKFSLDELPELYNVLLGDMSLVGPRPELDSVANEHFRQHPRHLVRPGLTGPYQVSELRLTGKLEPGLDLDEDYAKSVSLKTDLGLLMKTVGALVRGTGS